MKITPKKLCMDLLYADTEEEVVDLLKRAGYWDDPAVWRLFGDREDNYTTFGNQARTAEGALAEKLVNSVDAVLMGKCWVSGVRPNSMQAPQSIRNAVARFFGDGSRPESQGDLSNWPEKKRLEVSSLITLSATGSKSNPSITVSDAGEGQSPDSLPSTILSLDEKNKINIHFVQGTFNMGGTGALRFCGEKKLQLVISKRNPGITIDKSNDPSSNQWGFTIVRREIPTGNERMSTHKYLAPENNKVLRFPDVSLTLFPDKNKAYSRGARWGTVIKLYEYKLRGKSHILLGDGLLQRLDILLPTIALPVRLHECRGYSGKRGSFANSLTGLRTRLRTSDNMETGFPTSSAISVDGQKMDVSIYAFKQGKSGSYKKSEGVIFTLNVQTQGSLNKRFFSSPTVGLQSLQDSLLVIVDCSEIDRQHKEDLFMNSRDRMENGPFLKAIKSELQAILKSHQGLRSLREQRQREDIESKLGNSKPLEDMLRSILRKSPALASYLGVGGRLSDPFKSKTAKPAKEFRGKPHPTIFHFRDKTYGEKLFRTTPSNMRSRIVFETDAANDYFERGQYPGKFALNSQNCSNPNGSLPNHNLNLWKGIATLNLNLPQDAKVGDSYDYELKVSDETLMEPFINRFRVSVGPSQKPSGGDNRNRRQHTEGSENGKGTSRQGLDVPTPILIYEPEWDKHEFDKYSALKAVYYPSADGQSGSYTYYINMDNVSLKTELKGANGDAEILKARWQFGMVLVAMAFLRNGQDNSASNGNGNEYSESDETPLPEEKVIEATRAIAPVLLPMIEHLGGLSDDDIS